MKKLKIFIYVLAAFAGLSFYLYAQTSSETKVEKVKQTTPIKKEPIVKTTDNSKEELISLAKSKLGSPYVYAKSGPDSFDCSGFVYYVFKEHNMSIPRTSIDQSKIEGDKLTKEELQKGDLIFFDTSLKGHVNHSGIYLGGGKFIHASSGKANGVTISDINGWYKDKFKWGIRK